MQHEVILHADVIEYGEFPQGFSFREASTDTLQNKKSDPSLRSSEYAGFKIGDSVVFKVGGKTQDGVIEDIEPPKVKVQYMQGAEKKWKYVYYQYLHKK